MAGRFVRASKYRAYRRKLKRSRIDMLTLLDRPRLWKVYEKGILLRQPPYQSQCLGYKLGQGASYCIAARGAISP